MGVERLQLQQSLNTQPQTLTPLKFDASGEPNLRFGLDSQSVHNRSLAEKPRIPQQESSTDHFTHHCTLHSNCCCCSLVSAAEEGRDQCPPPEHPVPDHRSKGCQSAEGQDSAKSHLTDGKTAAANEAATVCQHDPLKLTMSLNGSFSFVWSDSLGIYSQWQSVFKK